MFRAELNDRDQSGEGSKLEEQQYRAEYDITKLVDAPPAGFVRVGAFLTANNKMLLCDCPRRPAMFALPCSKPIKASNHARAGSLEILIRVPDTRAAQLAQSEAYVFQIEGVH